MCWGCSLWRWLLTSVQLADYLNARGLTSQGRDIRKIDFRAKNICKLVFQNIANRYYQNTKRSTVNIHSLSHHGDSLSNTSDSFPRDSLPPEVISSNKSSSLNTRVMGWVIVLQGLLIIYLLWRNWRLERRQNESVFKWVLNGLLYIF